jgi:hypothetical protein
MDMAMRGALAAAVVALLAVTGCSGEPGGKPATAPLAAATTMPSVTPTTMTAPLSKKQAAERYLAIVKPYNLALERLEQAINQGRPVATVRTLAGKVASANQAHMRDLRATLWPVEVRAPVRELLAESARAQVYWRQAAHASTRSELIQVALKAARHDGSEAASSIRHRLDLGTYDERDYS